MTRTVQVLLLGTALLPILGNSVSSEKFLNEHANVVAMQTASTISEIVDMKKTLISREETGSNMGSEIEKPSVGKFSKTLSSDYVVDNVTSDESTDQENDGALRLLRDYDSTIRRNAYVFLVCETLLFLFLSYKLYFIGEFDLKHEDHLIENALIDRKSVIAVQPDASVSMRELIRAPTRTLHRIVDATPHTNATLVPATVNGLPNTSALPPGVSPASTNPANASGVSINEDNVSNFSKEKEKPHTKLQRLLKKNQQRIGQKTSEQKVSQGLPDERSNGGKALSQSAPFPPTKGSGKSPCPSSEGSSRPGSPGTGRQKESSVVHQDVKVNIPSLGSSSGAAPGGATASSPSLAPPSPDGIPDNVRGSSGERYSVTTNALGSVYHDQSEKNETKTAPEYIDDISHTFACR